MKPGVLLTGTTLITALFLTLHVADDIARGIDTIGLHTLTAILVLGLWLYETLVLGGIAEGTASIAAPKGSLRAALQQVLGHASITTTQRYARLSDEAVMREAARIGDRS